MFYIRISISGAIARTRERLKEYTGQQLNKEFYKVFKSEELTYLDAQGDRVAVVDVLMERINKAVYGKIKLCLERNQDSAVDEQEIAAKAIFDMFVEIIHNALARVILGEGQQLLPKPQLCLHWSSDEQNKHLQVFFWNHVHHHFSSLIKRSLSTQRIRDWKIGGFFKSFDDDEINDLRNEFIISLVTRPERHIRYTVDTLEERFDGYLINHLIYIYSSFIRSRRRQIPEDVTVSLEQFEEEGGYSARLKVPFNQDDFYSIMQLLQSGDGKNSDLERNQFLAFVLNICAGIRQEHIALLLGVRRNTIGPWIAAKKKTVADYLEQHREIEDKFSTIPHSAERLTDDEQITLEYQIETTLVRLKEQFAPVQELQAVLHKGIHITALAQMFIEQRADDVITAAINQRLIEARSALRVTPVQVQFIKRLHALRPEVRELLLYRAYLGWPLQEIVGGYIIGLSSERFYELWQEGVTVLGTTHSVTEIC